MYVISHTFFGRGNFDFFSPFFFFFFLLSFISNRNLITTAFFHFYFSPLLCTEMCSSFLKYSVIIYISLSQNVLFFFFFFHLLRRELHDGTGENLQFHN